MPVSFSAQKRRLLGVAIILLAVAVLGLAAKAKTSHYAPASSSTAYFSSSVKISNKAHTLGTMLPANLMPSPAPSLALPNFSVPLVVTPAAGHSAEPPGGLLLLRAPPASFTPRS